EAAAKLGQESARMVLALGYEALGKMDQAKEQYEAMLKEKPHDPVVLRSVAGFFGRSGQNSMAQRYLTILLLELDKDLSGAEEKKKPGVRSTQVWARRYLALLQAATRERGDFDKALKLLDKNLEENRNSSQDQRARAIVLGLQPKS